MPLFNSKFNNNIFSDGNPNNLNKVYNSSGFNKKLFNTALTIISTGRGGLSKVFNGSIFNDIIFNQRVYAATIIGKQIFNRAIFSDTIFNTAAATIYAGRGGLAKVFNTAIFNSTVFNDKVNEITTDVGKIFNRDIFNNKIFNGRGSNVIGAILYKLVGITYSGVGVSSILGNVLCKLFKDNLDTTSTFIAETTSHAITGVYSFLGLTNNDPQYFVVGTKAGTPNKYDTTDHNLVPEIQ